jgi:hypothetical protein
VHFVRSGVHERRSLFYRVGMRFPDSTLAALQIAAAPDDESAGWGRLLWLAIVLTVAAVSAGLLAGG